MNCMKRQKSATFVKNNSNRSTLMLKIIVKLKKHCHFTGKRRVAAHSIRNLNCSIKKKFLWLFKMHHFFQKKLKGLIEMENKLQKRYLIELLTAPDLW